MVTVGALRVVAGADVRGVGAAGGRARAGARAEGGRARRARHGAQQEGVPREARALARRARRGRAERVARARLPRGCGPSAGGRVRRAGAGAGDRGRARAGRVGLAQQHGVPRRVPRHASRHTLLLAGHRQIYERAASAPRSVCYRHVIDTLRGLLSFAWFHGPPTLLHRTLGPHRVSPEGPHLFQPTGPASLPDASAPSRETAPRCRRNQYLWNRVNRRFGSV